ncbi:SusC/RagA family TonB-linked outer membrane protein [Bacteroides acidifaciens]|uniref:SusC/RagA family TonB-linked outer membrane protein n=1 Tax=Bacteroides acidifaciens TaxID=85831 RepID=UPI002675F27E|nr:SusC/RagA family TonB-linked outer membrane protein [Bacteroides acidifaciens]
MKERTRFCGIRWLCLLILLCGSVMEGRAQADKNVTVQLKNASLRNVFDKIKEQANVGFIYSNSAISTLPRKDYDFQNVAISKVIAYSLTGSMLTFEIEDNKNIIIKKKKGMKDITGVVVDAQGEPIIGAAIQEKGTLHGTTTDLDGRFALESFGNKDIQLVVSYIGMKRQVVTWKGNTLRIKMEDDAQNINEVVVTGYQTIDRRKTTAAISSVKMDDVLMPDMTTIDQALEGRIPDLLFSQNSGNVGATARLRVRGTSTLVGNREPLWVLDGFILQDPVNVSIEQLNDPDYINYIGNAISGINPQDIERIDVLKDAAATALYGTRAANGVIVVTTKKGHVGTPVIRYSNQTKLVVRPHYSDKNINLMNSQERMQFGKDLCDLHYVFPQYMTMVGYEGAFHRFQTGVISYEQFLNEVKNYETTNTDWFDLMCRNAVTHSHTVSLSGGTESTRYYSSVGYTRENGTVNTEYTERYTAALNLTTNISKQLRTNFRINANIQKKNHLPGEVNALQYAYETTRALPAYNPDGSLFYHQKHGYSVGENKKANNQYNYNILNEMENTSSDYSGNTFNASGEVKYNLLDMIDFTAGGSYSRSSTAQSVWFGENTNYVAILKNGEAKDIPQTGESGVCELPYGGVYNTTNTITESITGRLQANFHRFLDSENTSLITATLGYEASAYRSNAIADETRGLYQKRGMQYATMEGADLDDFPYYKNWLAKGHRQITAAKTNTISGYLTLAYEYKNFFTVGMNGRFDASNKFGSRSNEKFLPVWSASGRLNVKETMLNKCDWLDLFDIRFSYGKTGNMLDNQTANMLIKQGTMDGYYGQYISEVVAFPNPNLRWEQTGTTNLGLELSLFERRLTLSGDVWFKHTTDAFSSINISTVNGISSYQMNNGTIDNKGYSFYISGYPIRTKDWSLYLSTGYSWADNTVRSGTNENFSLDDYLSGTAIVNGLAIGTFYSYKYLGLNPNTGIPMFEDYRDRRHLLANKKLADVIPLVMTTSGNRDPKLTGSFYTTLKWKQLSANLSFNYRIGSKIRLFNLYDPISKGISSDKNVRKEFLNRWMKPGDEKHTNIPVLLSPSDPNYESTMSHWCLTASAKVNEKIPAFAGNTWSMYDNSDLRVVSGNYLQLSNLVFSYDFRPEQLKETFIKALRMSLSTTNVFTIASKKLDGQDPTQAGFAGVSMSTRPSYTFNINISF